MPSDPVGADSDLVVDVSELVVDDSDPVVDVEQPARAKIVLDNVSNAAIRRHKRRLSTMALP